MAWIQKALDGWEGVSVAVLEVHPWPLPWMVFFDTSCAWHLAPDPAGFPDADPVSVGLTFAGEAVPVSIKRHDDGIWLPTGSTIPIEGTAFTSIYEREDGERAPYFVLALMDVWSARLPDASPELAARIERTMLGVATHEIVHTRQIADVARRIDELRDGHTLPERLGDDMVEERFKDEPGFREAHEKETDLLYRAVSEPDLAGKRALVREALALIRARQAAYFTGPDAVYSELEELFLNMEGVALWAAYRLSRMDPSYDLGIGDDPAANRARNTWTQDQGLALFLLIDELVPEWRERVLGGELASPYGLLEESVSRASCGGV